MRSALLLPPLMVLACGALCPGYTNKGGGRSAEKATKRTIYHSKPGGISLALSSDGRSLFVVNEKDKGIAVLEVISGKLRTRLAARMTGIQSVAVAADNTLTFIQNNRVFLGAFPFR